MRNTHVRRFGALVAGLVLIAAACGGDDDDDATSDTDAAVATEAPSEDTSADTTAAPGTTAATEDSAAATTAGEGTTAPTGTGEPGEPGALEGLKGTTPLVELSSDFTDRLLEVDPSLVDFNYAAETYDATTIIALAVEQAQDDGIAYAELINGITRDGEKCTDYATCKAILDAGGDPDLDGFSGPLEFAGNGEPLEASYGLLNFGADNRIDNALTEFLPASAPPEADVAAGARRGHSRR